jgi:DNA invertase Pin-like site-specific DNA recombinase
MLISPQVRRAGIYTRVSRDKRRGTAREAASVEQQESEARAIAEELGIHVAEVYCDNDVSASRYSTKTRKDWSRFVADIASGAIDFVFLWESSRGSRRLSEWSTFLDLARDNGVPVHVVSHETTYDLRKPRDWKVLASEGVESAAESDKTSLRIKRDKAALRREGRPDGLVPFGHTREYDPKSGTLLRQVPHPAEAPVVAELFARVLAGEPISRIAADLNQRLDLPEDDPKRVPLTRRGSRWRPDSVRRTVMNPAHIGMRPKTGTDELMLGGWEPIVSEDTWWAVHRLLTDPSRKRSKPGNAKHLLSNIMTCAECTSTVGVHKVSGAARYACRGLLADGSPAKSNGCVAIKQEWADLHVKRLVIARLSEQGLFAKAGAEPNDSAAVAARARADQLRAKLDEMWAYVKRGLLTMDEYVDAKQELQPQIAAAEAASQMSGMPPLVRTLMGLLGDAGDAEMRKKLMWRAWDKIEIAGRRDLVKGMFARLELKRGVQRSRTFDPDRIGYEWRNWDGSEQ